MSFCITGLPLSQFAPLFSLSDEQLATHDAIRVIADERSGFPCRVSLQDAQLGESLILLNYEHLPVASPYRSRHAIYVRESATEAVLDTNEVPALLRSRSRQTFIARRYSHVPSAEAPRNVSSFR